MLNCFILYPLLDTLVVECWLRVREVPGSIPSQGPHHIKDITKMVPVVPLFSTEHKNTGSFSIKTQQKTNQIAIIPSLRVLWKIDFCQIISLVKYRQNKLNILMFNCFTLKPDTIDWYHKYISQVHHEISLQWLHISVVTSIGWRDSTVFKSGLFAISTYWKLRSHIAINWKPFIKKPVSIWS